MRAGLVYTGTGQMKRDHFHVNGENRGLPGFLYAGYRHFTRARKPVRWKRENCLVISFVVSGEQKMVTDGHAYVLRGNDVLIQFPGEERHTGGEPRGKCLLFYLAIRPDRGRLPGCVTGEVGQLWRALKAIPQHKLSGTPALKRLFSDLIDTLENRPFLPLSRVSSLIAGILLHVVDISRRVSDTTTPERLSKVISYMEDNIENRIAVDECAAIAGLSVARFQVFFREKTGIPPAEYVLRKKIERARTKLLDPSSTITDIAFALDFSSSQYFATVFRRFVGKSPQSFRKSAGV
jgi:AraC-like DNA-binding protein